MDIEAINPADLRTIERSLNNIGSDLTALGRGLDHVESQVRLVQTTQNQMGDRLEAVARELQAFITQDRLDKSLAIYPSTSKVGLASFHALGPAAHGHHRP